MFALSTGLQLTALIGNQRIVLVSVISITCRLTAKTWIHKRFGSNPQFLEHFSVNFARSAKIDNSSVQSGEQSDFSHKIIKSNV